MRLDTFVLVLEATSFATLWNLVPGHKYRRT
jgi:hypothetical protein